MKNLTMSLMIAAATLVSAAGSASAQTLKADIPFTFRTSHGLMQPGTYDIRLGLATGVVVFQNRDVKGNTAAMIANPARSANGASVDPKLRFRCAEDRCVLVELWTGQDAGYEFRAPKLGHDDHGRIAEVRLTLTKAD